VWVRVIKLDVLLGLLGKNLNRRKAKRLRLNVKKFPDWTAELKQLTQMAH